MQKLTFVIFAILFTSAPAMAQGFRGTDFWLAFPQNAIIEGDKILSLTLYITAESRASGTITYLESTVPFSIETGSSIKIDLDTELDIRSSGKTERKAVHVISNQDVSIFAVSHRPATTDSYMAIPTEYLGTDYAVAGYTSLKNGPMTFTSQAAIVGTLKNTLVTIHLAGATMDGLPKGRSVSFVLDSGDTYQIQGSQDTGDLTGTTVTSTRPIAFFTGHSCAQVPVNKSYCDMLLEMEAPSNNWGKSYILTKFAKKDYYVARVIARDDSTEVSLDGDKRAWLMRGDFYEFDKLTSDAVITATKPILVAQYCTSSTADSLPVADPFMLLAIPNDRFVSEVTTVSDLENKYQDYLNVVVPDSGVSSLTIDNTPVATGKLPFQYSLISERKVPSANATIYTFLVPPWRHLVQCSSPIAIYAYGLGVGNSNYDSYGHGCGMRLDEAKSNR